LGIDVRPGVDEQFGASRGVGAHEHSHSLSVDGVDVSAGIKEELGRLSCAGVHQSRVSIEIPGINVGPCVNEQFDDLGFLSHEDGGHTLRVPCKIDVSACFQKKADAFSLASPGS
jgi:hypothetical protein